MLNQLDWQLQGQLVLTCLNATFNKVMRDSKGSKKPIANNSLNTDHESLMELCLGLFYTPSKPIPEEVI